MLVQNARTLFCYFNNSSVAVKEFKDRYGEDSWNNSKPVIKVYAIENGSAKEIKSIIIDSCAVITILKLNWEFPATEVFEASRIRHHQVTPKTG